MKVTLFSSIMLCIALNVTSINAADLGIEDFANDYFNAWTASQAPSATKQDIENYLSLLADDIGHQHLPYDPDDTRTKDGKSSMRIGMNHYLGVHTKYQGTLVDVMLGHDVIVLQYDTEATGIHPQSKELITLNFRTTEVLEIENGKVSVIRKYSE